MATAAGRGPAANQEEVEEGDLPLEEGAFLEEVEDVEEPAGSEVDVDDPVAAYILGRPLGGGAIPRPSRFREISQPRIVHPRAQTRRVSNLYIWLLPCMLPTPAGYFSIT